MIENKGEMQFHITDIRRYIDPTAARLLNHRLQCSRRPTVAVALKPGKAVGRAMGNLISCRLCALRSKYNRNITTPAAIALHRSRATIFSRRIRTIREKSYRCHRHYYRKKWRMRSASRIPLAGFLALPSALSDCRFKRGNTNLP